MILHELQRCMESYSSQGAVEELCLVCFGEKFPDIQADNYFVVPKLKEE